MIASEAVTVWQALGIVAGGIVSGVTVLSLLAKAPGGRWLFARLVSDPLRLIVAEVMTTEVHGAVEASVERHVSDKLEPIAVAIEQINVAVNHTAPGAPALKDRVAGLEAGQGRIEGQLSIIRDVMERLVQRP